MVLQQNLFGWMTSTSYQADPNRSLGSWKMLVDEICEYGLNYLCIIPESEGSDESGSWGLDWPASDPDLRNYRNRANRNSSEETEYLSQLLDYAQKCGVQVDLFLWMYVWPQVMQREKKYQSEIYINGEKKRSGHCWDNPELIALMKAKVRDLGNCYGDKVVGLVIEGPRYNWRPDWPYHELTRDAFRTEKGKEIDEIDREEVREWKRRRISQMTAEIAEVARSSGFSRFGVHNDATITITDTAGNYIVGGIRVVGDLSESGESPKHYKTTGEVDFLAPELHMLDKAEFVKMLAYSAQYLPCVPHICCRGKVTPGYRDPAKSPADIARQIEWLLEFRHTHSSGGNLRGAMYFNEAGCFYDNRVPMVNRKAVFEGLRRLKDEL